MRILGAFAWLITYLVLFYSFMVFGWQWSEQIATAQAACVWFALSLGLGALGVYVVIRLGQAEARH